MPPSSTKLLVLDTETTMSCDREGYSSSFPHDPRNQILTACALHYDGEATLVMGYIPPTFSYEWANQVFDVAKDRPILVGHNIKFDLSYLYRQWNSLANELMTLPVWDTQIAEYILSGQQELFPSLDQCVKHWLPPSSEQKDDLIQRLIAEGKTTEDVPIQELYDYCQKDTILTLHVAMEQMKAAKKLDPKLIDLIIMQSSVTKVLTEMECRGMRYDTVKATTEMSSVIDELNRGLALLAKNVYDELLVATGDMDFAHEVTSKHIQQFVGSNDFWGCLFFGGEYTFKWKEAGAPWKSGLNKGKPRFTHKTRTVKFAQACAPKLYGSERTKTGAWSMDDAVLAKLSEDSVTAENLRGFRKLNKLLNTYFLSFPKHLFEGVLHPSIHQTSTHTGRLSQSKPNLQNVASIDRVKRCFVPSAPDLAFIEADYKQLEMIIFAYLYRDDTLLSDLRSGLDVHGYIGQQLFGAKYNHELRRKVKGVVFGMIYGGGAQTLSEQVGLPIADVQKVISLFHKRYPAIRHYRIVMADHAARMTAANTDTSNIDGHTYWMMPSMTGRRYGIMMNKEVVPTGIVWKPSYTNLCNYPIQGLATGDIVPMMLLHVWNEIRREQRPITMVNTVHDSILFEVPKCDVEHQMEWIKHQLESAPKVFEHWFNKELDLGLPVSVKYSKDSWAGPWVEWTPF